MNQVNQQELIVNFPIIDVSDDGDSLTLTNNQIATLIPDVGTDLAWLNVAGADAVTQGTQQAPLFVNIDLLQVVGDNVAIEAAGEDAEALLIDLEALGLESGVAFGNLVSGLIPIEVIDEVANLTSLEFARPVYKSITNAGSTTSQGDVAMNSDDARTNFGIDGTGITVGVLSDSYDTSTSATTNASDDIASGDLPAGINVLQDGTSPSTNIDEGRAMLQLIHDVAPGADLAFHTAFGGQPVFAQGILDLAAAGSEVIVDDVINLGEPMFQDGIVAQAVDQVVASGVPYFSSAGNNARQSYESAFNGSGIINGFNFGGGLVKFYEWHDFSGAGDIFQAITVPVGATAQFSFQWDEPFFSASGVSGSTSDIDIFLTNGEIVTNIVSASISSNIGGDAVETFAFTNDGSQGTESFNIIIGNAGGPDPGLMKYVEFGGISIDEYDTASPTSFGHANAAGASSVGAAFYFFTPEFGTSPPQLESFSSPGGIDILFDTAGNRLVTPESRQNVDIVAPDGTNTTFFGQQIGDGDSFPNFFGTSAAAPHAAAVAALMLESAGGAGSLTPSEVYSALETTAIDMLTPGYDADSGFGLIDANAAVAAVTPPTIEFSQATYSVGEGDGTTNVVTLTRSSTTGTSEVQVSITGGTATGGTDYNNGSFPLNVMFSDGESSKTVAVPILEDSIYEPTAETIDFSVTTVSNAEIGTQSTTTLNINDNDSQPTVSLSLSDSPLAENGGVATVTATLSNESTEDVTVNLGFLGTATGSGTDYTASNSSITITAGSTTGSITLTGNDDAIAEADETIIVGIDSVTNGTEDGVQQVTATITEDDIPTISIDDVTVTEGNDAIFTVSLSTASTQTITVDYATANDTATAGSDYTANSNSLTFNPDETSQTITVQGLGDTDFEGAEQFFVDLSNPSNATIADNQGIGTITDDDFNISSQPNNWELQGTADFDGDGKADLIWRDPSTGDNQLWLMDGETVVSSNDLNPAHPNWKIAGVNDFNGDGKADLLLRNSVTGENSQWLYDGATRIDSGNTNRATLDWDVADINDFNGDNKADILLRNSVTGENSMWLYDGRTRIESGNIKRATVDWEVADTNDFNGDGKADILLRNSIGQNSLWTMDGRTRIGSGNINGASPEWEVADTNDFNGDNKADILWRNTVTGENSLWMMDERTRIDTSNIGNAAIRWEVGGTGDFDGDGDTDIFWRDPLTGDNALWLMNGVTNPTGDLI